MEKIASFSVNHLNLEPGIYESRRDDVNGVPIITYDLRLTRPNREPVLNTAEIHTVEHIAATYLRNHEKLKDNIIYFGPMGCRTGFYLILKDELSNETVFNLIHDTFEFISNFEDVIPGATARDCGNFQDQNLGMAQYISKRYVLDLQKLENYNFIYQD